MRARPSGVEISPSIVVTASVVVADAVEVELEASSDPDEPPPHATTRAATIAQSTVERRLTTQDSMARHGPGARFDV